MTRAPGTSCRPICQVRVLPSGPPWEYRAGATGAARQKPPVKPKRPQKHASERWSHAWRSQPPSLRLPSGQPVQQLRLHMAASIPASIARKLAVPALEASQNVHVSNDDRPHCRRPLPCSALATADAHAPNPPTLSCA